jgi:SNF2 family DNA or RNA helicase
MKQPFNSFHDALVKFAALKTELLPHQQRVIDRLREQEGLLVAHGLGTGKTLASIGVADALGGRTEALVPASLQANYAKEIEKHVKGKPNINIRSMQGAALKDEKIPADLLVVDEAHRARETKTKLNKLLRDYPAAKRMLLSATPAYNRPGDIAPLVNIVAGEKVLPTGTDFRKRYIGESRPGIWASLVRGERSKPILKNTKELQKALNKWVDYEPTPTKDFPERINSDIEVEMSPYQTKVHNMAWDQLPWSMRMRLKRGLPPEKQDVAKLNRFESQSRQISGSMRKFTKDKAEITPKLQRALNDLQARLQDNPEHRAVVYSNYLDTLGEYGEALEAAGVPYGSFTGNLSQKKRKELIDQYNAGKLKALLVSSAGGEGLDLKGTRQMQVLEPHWNDTKLEQVIGRAIRRGSHAHLPEDQRKVDVQRYITHPKPGFMGRMVGSKPLGVENVLANMSSHKDELNKQLIQLLSQQRDQ